VRTDFDPGKGPNDLPLTEYRVLHRLVELVPQEAAEGNGADLNDVVTSFREEIDAMGSIAHMYSTAPGIDHERLVKAEQLVRNLEKIELARCEFGPDATYHPTLKGRQLVQTWHDVWSQKSQPWFKRSLVPYIGEYLTAGNMLGVLSVFIAIVSLLIAVELAHKRLWDLLPHFGGIL
jgi:hypothetical protein